MTLYTVVLVLVGVLGLPLVGAAQTVSDAQIRHWLTRLEKSDSLLAAEAEDSLVGLGKRCLPLVEPLCTGAASDTTKRRAVRVLGRIGDVRTIPTLVAVLGRRNLSLELRLEVARALCGLRHLRGVDELLSLLAAKNPSMRMQAHVAWLRYTRMQASFRFDAKVSEREEAVSRLSDWWAKNRSSFQFPLLRQQG